MSALAREVAWVTGAGTGIGKAGALMFAREGASVALMGRRRDKLEEVAAEIRTFGGTGAVQSLDVADRAQVQKDADHDVNTPIMARRKVKYPPEMLEQFIQPDDLAETMRFVAPMPKRTSIPETLIYPTNIRPYTAAETGLSS